MTASPPALRSGALDRARLSGLRLRAREVAEGVLSGAHRSHRRGHGVEFGGHREYLPGDDLRFLDRRALLRHGRLLVREFETETERGLHLLVDATRSMAYRSEGLATTKLEYASVLAAALARVAVAGADRVSLDFLGGREPLPVPTTGGLEGFERIVDALEELQPDGDPSGEPDTVRVALRAPVRRSRRGGIVVVFSDFLDPPETWGRALAELGAPGRASVAVRVLDPAEARFPFTGPVELRATEGTARVHTEAGRARAGYLAALARQTESLRSALTHARAGLVLAETTDDPSAVVRAVLEAARRGPA